MWQKQPLVGVRVESDMNIAFLGARSLLSGTGWASDLEHQARKVARARGIRTIAVLDHWVNYSERFHRNGETVLPDEIYVTDRYALLKATQIFPNIPVRVYENVYLAIQLSEILQSRANAVEVLYLLEPIRADWPRHIAGEFEALEYFLENWHRLDIPNDTTLRIRPHPSDSIGKYNDWLANHAHQNIVLDSGPLSLALAKAFWVAGCETYAMAVALAAGKIVISALPPWAPPCRLPHEAIIRLNELDLKSSNTNVYEETL
ncbi:hypothetical protein N9K58_07595 [Alphaproteobacteria bacterium]|nr:hypothetical protein [Alphaproteobacteria bacterium]